MCMCVCACVLFLCVCVCVCLCVGVCVYSGSESADKDLVQAPSKAVGQYNTGTELPESGGQ